MVCKETHTLESQRSCVCFTAGGAAGVEGVPGGEQGPGAESGTPVGQTEGGTKDCGTARTTDKHTHRQSGRTGAELSR